jgi:hypothetical protein
LTDSVFVSYSRSDWRMATRVVQLLRARDDVFYDVDSIPAGAPWRDALLRAIDDASHFYLLWCKHSAGSEEVEWEWQRAISGSKRLVPVLLDSTPLIMPLAKYQSVDLRGVVKGHQVDMRPVPLVWTLALAVLSIIFVTAALLLVPSADDPTAVPPEAPSVWPTVWVVLAILAVLALVALITRRYQRSRRTRRANEQLAEAIANDLATHTS